MSDVIDRPPLHLFRPNPPPPQRRRPPRKAIIAAIVALAVVLALLGWLIFSGSPGSRHTASPAPSKASRTVAVTPPQRPVSTTCRLPAGSQAIPASPPADVTWKLFNTVALPSSPTAGPEFVAGDVARCYAHSPTGALIADLQISSRHLIASGWRAVMGAQVVPGPGVKAFDTDRAEVTGGLATPGQYCQTAGFNFLSYTPVKATIEVVARCGSNLQAETTNVAWSGTDWRLVLLPNGSEAPSASTIGSLVGFVPFGGV
jgi:hypothetical protein